MRYRRRRGRRMPRRGNFRMRRRSFRRRRRSFRRGSGGGGTRGYRIGIRM